MAKLIVLHNRECASCGFTAGDSFGKSRALRARNSVKRASVPFPNSLCFSCPRKLGSEPGFEAARQRVVSLESLISLRMLCSEVIAHV